MKPYFLEVLHCREGKRVLVLIFDLLAEELNGCDVVIVEHGILYSVAFFSLPIYNATKLHI
jgi:hypothetical protein